MVVTILGIIATIVGVSVGSRDDLKLSSSARVLVADLQYIQSRAIVQRQPHFIQVGTSGGALALVVRENGAWVTLEHPVERSDFVMVFGPQGSGGGKDVLLSAHDFGGNAMFGFDETGSPMYCDANADNQTSATTVTSFELKAGEQTKRVMVQPITGEISVQ